VGVWCAKAGRGGGNYKKKKGQPSPAIGKGGGYGGHAGDGKEENSTRILKDPEKVVGCFSERRKGGNFNKRGPYDSDPRRGSDRPSSTKKPMRWGKKCGKGENSVDGASKSGGVGKKIGENILKPTRVKIRAT